MIRDDGKCSPSQGKDWGWVSSLDLCRPMSSRFACL